MIRPGSSDPLVSSWIAALDRGLKPGEASLWASRLDLSAPLTDALGHQITPTAFACARCKPGTLRELLRAGASPEGFSNRPALDTGSSRRSALGIAAQMGHLECAQALLLSGAAIEPSDSPSPLALALQSGQADCASFLLASGASPRSKTGLPSSTFLGLALERSLYSLARPLLEAGASSGPWEIRSLRLGFYHRLSHRLSDLMRSSRIASRHQAWEALRDDLDLALQALIDFGSEPALLGSILAQSGKDLLDQSASWPEPCAERLAAQDLLAWSARFEARQLELSLAACSPRGAARARL